MTTEDSVTLSLKQLADLEQQRQAEEAQARRRAHEEAQRRLEEQLEAARAAEQALLDEEERMRREAHLAEAKHAAEVEAHHAAELYRKKLEVELEAKRKEAALLQEITRASPQPPHSTFKVWQMVAIVVFSGIVGGMFGLLFLKPATAPVQVQTVTDDTELRESRAKLLELQQQLDAEKKKQKEAEAKAFPSMTVPLQSPRPPSLKPKLDTTPPPKVCPPGVPLCN